MKKFQRKTVFSFHRGRRLFSLLFCHPQPVGCLMTFRAPNILSSYIYVQWKKNRSKRVSLVFYVKRSVISTSPSDPELGHSWSCWVILWVYHIIICGLGWTWIFLTDLGQSWYLGWDRNLVFLQSRTRPERNHFLSA